jgi:S-adenosylmethionine hydrolase
VIVTLTTDFGLADGYVAAMKGAILRIAPQATLVDVSHQVGPQDVMGAAFVLAQALPHFPDGAVHLVVVDPGVGTDRRAIAAHVGRPGPAGTAGAYTFVGPDNGVLALLLADPDAGGGVSTAVQLDRPEAWGRPAPSATFHGRDVFGPVAARIALGAALTDVGTPVAETTRLHWPLPITDDDGIDGMVLHVDRYGNCLTNVSREAVERLAGGRAVKCYVGSAVVRGIGRTYGAVPAGEPVALYGSGGHLEIAVNGGDAARLLSVERGATVNLLFDGARADGPAAGDGALAAAPPAQPRTLA